MCHSHTGSKTVELEFKVTFLKLQNYGLKNYGLENYESFRSGQWSRDLQSRNWFAGFTDKELTLNLFGGLKCPEILVCYFSKYDF